MKVIYKYNSGIGGTICNECRTIISTGKRVERFYCDKCQNKLDDILVKYYEVMDKEVHTNKGNLNK